MNSLRSHFSSLPAIAYGDPRSKNPLAFRHYHPDEKIGGKTMAAHLRFSIAYWHSFRGTGADPFGPGTINRPWENGRDPIAIAKTRMDAAFEFFQKIRAPFWCFHDRDIAPEGATLTESNRNLDQVVAHAKALRNALDKAHKPYEWFAVAKEGHGFYTEEHRRQFYEKLEAFLAKHLAP
jgi:xylose isomerase